MGLGDAFMFQSSLRAMLRAFPNAEFDLVAGRESQSRPMLERLISMEGRSFSRVHEVDYKSLSIKELRFLNQKLANEKYDMVHCTHMTPTPYYTKTILSAPIRMGPKIPWDKWYKPRPNGILNFSIKLSQDKEHETSRHARVVEKLIETPVSIVTPNLELSQNEKNYADVFWQKNDLESRFVIGTHFGASRLQHWKKWDDDRFAEVLRDLASLHNAVFLLFGTAEENSQLEEASKFVKERSINLAGKLSVFEVASLLAKCNYMLANDSGLGHVAMAVGTKTLRIFGMSDYWGFRTLSPDHIDVFKGIWCSPCLQLGMLKPYNVHNCGHKNCMKLITPEEVTSSFERLGS